MNARILPFGLLLSCSFTLAATTASAQKTVDAGVTGFDVKRPVLASACEHGCPWGELGDFVADALRPHGYDVVLCRNCNLDQGPRLVANASYPPELGVADVFVGTTTRVNAKVDFGITSSDLLAWAHAGIHSYTQYGAFPNLRLIAKIEDPTYLLVAVKKDSGITDLAQVADKKMPVKILGGGSPLSQPVLDHYGLTQDAVTSWGGVYENAIAFGQADDPEFDIAINEIASPAQNPESAYWTKITQKHDVLFLDIPSSVLDQLAGDKTLGATRVTVKWGFLRGVDRPIDTIARSGHAVFARDDAPEQAAYDVAKAIDEHRDGLKWYIRPYSYDSRTVWKNIDVPLHPGAERYYREVGYFTGGGGGSCPDASVEPAATERHGDSSCAIGRLGASAAGRSSSAILFLIAALGAARRPAQRGPKPNRSRRSLTTAS